MSVLVFRQICGWILCGSCTWWHTQTQLFRTIKMSKYLENKAYLYLLSIWRHFYDDGECSCKLWRHGIQFLFRLKLSWTSKFWRWPRIEFMGRPICTQLQSAFLSRKHTGNHLQQVSPFYHIGFHLLLKFCLVWIGRLGVKIVESFQFEFWPGVMSARFSLVSLWKVI